MVNRFRQLCLVLALAACWLPTTVLVARAAPRTAAAAAATSVQCTELGCNGKDPVLMGCSSDAVTLDSAAWGNVAVELRFSNACWAAWARVFVYNADIHYSDDGAMANGFPCSQGYASCQPAYIAYSPGIDPNAGRWEVYSNMISFTYWSQACDFKTVVCTGLH